MRTKAILVCTFLLICGVGAEAATYRTLHHFTSWKDGDSPFAGLTVDQAGNLYGVAAYDEVRDGGAVFELWPFGGDWTFGVLYGFDRYEQEGAYPMGGLAVDEAGNVYGTTSYAHKTDWTCGSVFKLSPMLTYLRYFTSGGAEGCDPEATLTYSNGLLWGTTRGGGSKGKGTVFSMDTTGNSFHFYSFSGIQGREPLGAFSAWGYGTTYSGGWKGKGNIYRLDPVKGLINKHSFKVDGKAGYAPMGDLLTVYVGGVRTIYGTTSTGGVGGGGTVYRLTEIEPNSDHWAMKVLHSFSSGDTQGWAPMAGLTADATGNLYGTTSRGGETDSNCGTVFKLSRGNSSRWTHSLLYSFDYYNGEDGCYPISGVVIDAAGNLYGTTIDGGWYSYGTVYEIIP